MISPVLKAHSSKKNTVAIRVDEELNSQSGRSGEKSRIFSVRTAESKKKEIV